ncbi:MAG TPA: type II toxin-antitoxin system RelE/ParE family toxin [Humisphaera sp.]|jgi:toxin ParE1/3/4|nr:type II toxin-antitoxin system RelE/ParE family toxin [Humisphaera sp.]
MPAIIKSKRAVREAAEIWHYIAQDNSPAADRLIDDIEHALRFLAEYPRAGKERSDLARSLRTYPVGNYLLFYRPMKDGIQLAHIIHGARDLRRLFPRRG